LSTFDPPVSTHMSELSDAAALHGTETADVQLSSRYQKERRDLERTDEHCPNYVRHGVIMQVNTINQFSDILVPCIKEHSHPTSCCGAMSLAHAMLLPSLIPAGGSLTASQLEIIVTELRNTERLLQQVRRAMRFIHDCRKAYIGNHPSSFENDPAKAYYMSAWVANYEVSDYLRAEAEAGRLAANVHFLRYNQWPERSSATHEEKERIVEEQRFGGEVEGDKGSSPLEPWASRFIIERFLPSRSLLSHAEAIESLKGAGNVFVLDLNGHFAVAVALNVSHDDSSTVVPTMLVINTTDGSYISGGPPAVAFDLAFPSEGPGPNSFVPSTKEAAVAMGATDHITVRPLDKCQHVLTSLSPLPESPDAAASAWLKTPCQECGAVGENMLCLECHAVFCGRYVKQHSLAHADASKHKLVMGLADMSVWCYGCDNFLDSYLIKDLHQVFSQVHQSKFGDVPMFPQGARSMSEVRFDPCDVRAKAAPVISEEKIKQISDMGFERQLCIDVLSAHGGNVEQALYSLLGM